MSTLLPPPPERDGKAPIEHALQLTHLKEIDVDLFTNTRPLWHPPGGRGIYGGNIIAQCLAAAQRTVPEAFLVHSMHCYFVLGGNVEIPILYAVEHVREGRSFATRTVQARQRGRAIFTTTMSFAREGAGGAERVEHDSEMPAVAGPPAEGGGVGMGADSPFECQQMEVLHGDDDGRPAAKRTRQWMRARGRISSEGGQQAHLSALANMSDSYFIGTVVRVHKLWRDSAASRDGKADVERELMRRLLDEHDDETILKRYPEVSGEQLKHVRANGLDAVAGQERGRELGMMVSLDHAIYFHRPRDFRADEWLFSEMESPWAGDGRGLVVQKMWTRDGKHVATCVQEGVVRLKQPEQPKM